MLLLLPSLLFACIEPEYATLDKEQPADDSEQAVDSDPQDSEPPVTPCEPAPSWSDPLTQLAELPINEDSAHLTDGVMISDDHLLVVGGALDQNGNAWLFDVSDPSAPRLVGESGRGQLMSVCWTGQEAYALSNQSELLRIEVDASGPRAPERVRQLDGPSARLDCDDQQVAWGANARGGGWATLQGVAQGFERIPGDVRDVHLEGGRLWVLGQQALTAWDQVEGQLVQRGSVELSGSCFDLDAGDDWLAAACGGGGVHLVQRGDGQPSLLGSWSGYAAARTVAVQQDRVWVAAWSDLLQLDASDPSAPTLVASEPANTAVTHVVTHDEQLMVVDWKRPYVVTPTEARAPELRLGTPSLSAGVPVQLSNDGSEPLCLQAPAVGEIEVLELAPGQRTLWSLPSALVNGELVELRSNDPDEQALSLRVGGVQGLSVGDQAPPFLERDLDAQLWELDALRGHVIFLGMLDSA